MQEIRFNVFLGLNLSEGLIFIDENAYDVQNITSVEHVIQQPKQSLYRVLAYTGLILMFYAGFIMAFGIFLFLLGMMMWRLSGPRHGLFIKTYPNNKRIFISERFEELEKLELSIRKAHNWQKDFKH